jgi:hypothetical protein
MYDTQEFDLFVKCVNGCCLTPTQQLFDDEVSFVSADQQFFSSPLITQH